MPTFEPCLPPGSASKRTNVVARHGAAGMATAALLLVTLGAAPARAAMLSQSVDVNASPAEVWALVGPYCAIETWLPPIGSCRLDDKTPPTRTLVTKDRAATFVELETERNDASRFYSYTFLSSPLPVRDYRSTIRVTSSGNGGSTVIWRSEYRPEPGREKEALDTLTTVYRAGLDSIASRFAR